MKSVNLGVFSSQVHNDNDYCCDLVIPITVSRIRSLFPITIPLLMLWSVWSLVSRPTPLIWSNSKSRALGLDGNDIPGRPVDGLRTFATFRENIGD